MFKTNKGNNTASTTIAFVAMAFLASGGAVVGAFALDDTRAVWLTTRTSAAQETWSNTNLDSGDLIVYHFGSGATPTNAQLTDLNDVTTVPDGRKGLEFFSAAEVVAALDEVDANNFGFVSYDLESGVSPAGEVAAPVTAISDLKDDIDAYNTAHSEDIHLMVAPSNAITNSNAAAIAGELTTGDRFHLQSQPKQDDDTTCAIMDSWVDNMRSTIETANAVLAGEITYQVTITGNAASGKTAFQTATDCMDATSPDAIDGLSIFWNGATWDDGSYTTIVQDHETSYS